MFSSALTALLLSAGLTGASPILGRAPSDYAPVPATCPSTPLVRTANGVSSNEAQYVGRRGAKAAQALEKWLKGIDSGFEAGNGSWGGHQGWQSWGSSSKQGKAPIIALTSSGGGYRAMLSGGGFIKGLDGREAGQSAVKGLYQALTYHAGLSGGSWLLSSIIGNDYPTISYLQQALWEQGLQNNVLVPPILLSAAASSIYADVAASVHAKEAAGYPPSIIDPWGRLLSYSLLPGPEGGVGITISDVAGYNNFTNYNAPYPVITALGVNRFEGLCIPRPNATQYEFSPFEFGSWDQGVDAFVSSQYLGTPLSNGMPNGSCITNLDNLGYVLGISSNVFGSICGPIPAANSTGVMAIDLVENFAELAAPGQAGLPESAIFGPIFPNPFKNFPSSSLVAAQSTLELVDGGVGDAPQGDPIWPFLHRPEIDVIIVNENSADNAYNFPNGSEIVDTYNAAMAAGLTRMPAIPSVDVFVNQGLNQKPTFFGCNSPNAATIIYVPNFNYTFQSGQPTAKILYYVNETQGMISNGVQIANYGGKQGWPLCLACGVMAKSGETLPAGCTQCLKDYCYN